MGVLPGLMSAIVLAAQGRVRGQCWTEMDKSNMHAGLAQQWTWGSTELDAQRPSSAFLLLWAGHLLTLGLLGWHEVNELAEPGNG
jgi:hypothetical protein